jgi:hypothetical protein
LSAKFLELFTLRAKGFKKSTFIENNLIIAWNGKGTMASIQH